MTRRSATYLLLVVLAAIVTACANIGSPEGGPRDYTPPTFVKSNPSQGQLNVSGNKIEITFDEIVNVKDQQKKVVVSPVQKNPPVIKALGRKITIELRDSLLPETTYCIDFSNAIEDNNEGNPIDGFSMAFSTGSTIDSLQISGMVLRAKDLEPMQHVIVGLHSNLNDTAFSTISLERISRTNDRGQFTLRNLKPGRYHIFALNDVDGDYRMARTEDVAFLDEIIVPQASRFESMDTVFTFDHRVDTVIAATHTEFTPNNVLLTMFNENYIPLYLKKTERVTPERLTVMMSTRSDTLPALRILEPPTPYSGNNWYHLERTARNDSLVYWLTDSTLIRNDSLKVELTYQRTDSTDMLTLRTDTVTFAYRKPNYLVKQEAEQLKERQQIEKRIAQLREKQAAGKSLDEEELEELTQALKPVVPKLKVDWTMTNVLEITDSIGVTAPVPIAHIDPAKVHLEMKRDTLWVPVDGLPPMVPADDLSALRYVLPMRLTPDSTYRITLDSLAVTSIYGVANDAISAEVRVRAVEDYANLIIRVNVPGQAFIDLLDNKDEVVMTRTVTAGVAKFDNVAPDTYYARLVIDANDNGKWDTGNYANHLQPEEVYYYPKAIKLRKNWDVEQQWGIYDTALDLQKPEAIKHNKPEQSKNALESKKNKKGKTTDDEDEEEDEFNSTGFSNGAYSGNKYRDYQNTRKSPSR